MEADESKAVRQSEMMEKMREIARKHQLESIDGRIYWTLDAVLLCMLDTRISTLHEIADAIKSGELGVLSDFGPQTGSPGNTGSSQQ